MISPIAVTAEWQHRGIGRRLMEQSEQWARQQGFEMMQLSVGGDNINAIGFYGKLGWERVLDTSGEWHGLMTKSLLPLPITDVRLKECDESQ